MRNEHNGTGKKGENSVLVSLSSLRMPSPWPSFCVGQVTQEHQTARLAKDRLLGRNEGEGGEAHEEKCLGAGRPEEGKMGGKRERDYKRLKYSSLSAVTGTFHFAPSPEVLTFTLIYRHPFSLSPAFRGSWKSQQHHLLIALPLNTPLQPYTHWAGDHLRSVCLFIT